MAARYRELPAEITESIIDCLYDDKDALKKCALVRRSWLPRCRYHLHKSVSLDNHAADHKLSGFYATGAAAYIQRLTLVAPPQPYGHHLPGSESHRARPLWTIATRFTNITNLTLVFFNWRGAHKSYERLAEIGRNVTQLTLVIAGFNDVADFLSFLSVFPQLTTLSVSSLSFGNLPGAGMGHSMHSLDNLEYFLDTTVAPQLQNLRFANTHPSPSAAVDLGRWLATLPKQIIAKSTLAWTGAGSIHALSHSLQAHGGNLAHLELDAPAAEKLAYEEENALRTSTGLETLTLKDLHYLAREEVRWLLLLLSRIPPSAFRKLEFVCTSSSFDGVDEHSLELLDEFLASPAFSQLEEVELDFSNGFKQRDLSGVVTRGLRRLGERGALRAHFPAFSTEVDK